LQEGWIFVLRIFHTALLCNVVKVITVAYSFIPLQIPLFEMSHFVSESRIGSAALVPCNVLHKGKGVTCMYVFTLFINFYFYDHFSSLQFSVQFRMCKIRAVNLFLVLCVIN
jgi:hypothetical protein